MKRLKRNWKWLLGFGIFISIYWIIVPSQYNYYLERDLIDFDLTETLVIVGIVFLISIVVLYRFLSLENDKFIRLMQTFAYSVFMGFAYLIWVHSIVIATGLFINRIVSTETLTEQFEITYIMRNGEVGIRSIEDQYFQRTEDKLTNLN